MLLLLLFAFLAGIFTILSPCILPILPAILAAGTMPGRRRPIAIILGLVISFTFFTLFLTAIVHATGLSANVLRYIAIALLFFFALTLISARLSALFAQLVSPLAALGERLQSRRPSDSQGLGGGFIFGMALGLLWTPCAGPILAAITTIVATQSIDISIILITLAYSLGAGIPMLLIAYGGRKVIQSSRFLSTHAEAIRQGFGWLMLLAALAMAMQADMLLQQQIAKIFPPILLEDNSLVKDELAKLRQLPGAPPKWLAEAMTDDLADYGQAPELTGIVNWINSPPLSLMQLQQQGKVVLIDFWTYSCINCLRTLPHIEKWFQDYSKDGLVVVGVHTPEFEFEKSPKNVAQATSQLAITYPIAQDNDYKTWQAYHNQYWPAHYLIDKGGHVRQIHFGEGAYAETEQAIRQLLGLPAIPMPTAIVVAMRPITAETYLGWQRAKKYSAEIPLALGQIAEYNYQKPLENDAIGLRGKWLVESEYISSQSSQSFLDLNFLAKQVYLVLSGGSQEPLQVYLDGQFMAKITWDGDRKYDIVDTSYGRHLLSIQVPQGVKAYAFTFGDSAESSEK